MATGKQTEDIEGYIYISRKIENHPSFKKKPFDEFHALIWLILNARYSEKPTTQYIGKAMITWGRGELPASLRFMGEAFGWPKSTVDRWLKTLVDNGTVERRETQAGTVLRLINYESYQKPGRKKERKTGQKLGQQNPLQESVSPEIGDSNRDTKGDSDADSCGTPAGQQRDKTEIKGVIKGEIQIERKECESTPTHFLNDEEEYTEMQKTSFQNFSKLIDQDYSPLRKFEIQFDISSYLKIADKHDRETIEQILSEISDKPDYHKKHRSLPKTFDWFIQNSKDLNEKSSTQSKYKTGQLTAQEETGRRIIAEVLGRDIYQE